MSSSPSLQGKVAIVTGGSRGIGYGIAWELARRGAKVAVLYTSPSSESQVDELAAKTKALDNGSQVVKVQGNMADMSTPKQLVGETVRAFGPHIDILVNNAAVEVNKPLGEIGQGDYEHVHNINVRGPLFLSQEVLPYLRKPGRIINISSVGARRGFPGYGLYTSSKAALEQLTRVWAAELGPQGHTVNAVCPGPVDTDMIKNITPSIVENQKANTPVEHRIATLDDIAQVVAFLADENSRWITGQCLSASGGLETY